MAWVDDRIWCHQKLADLSDRAFRVWVNGIAYSSGFQTKGCPPDCGMRTVTLVSRSTTGTRTTANATSAGRGIESGKDSSATSSTEVATHDPVHRTVLRNIHGTVQRNYHRNVHR